MVPIPPLRLPSLPSHRCYQWMTGPGNQGAVKFANSAFWGPASQIAVTGGTGTVSFTQCHFDSWDHQVSPGGKGFVQSPFDACTLSAVWVPPVACPIDHLDCVCTRTVTCTHTLVHTGRIQVASTMRHVHFSLSTKPALHLFRSFISTSFLQVQQQRHARHHSRRWHAHRVTFRVHWQHPEPHPSSGGCRGKENDFHPEHNLRRGASGEKECCQGPAVSLFTSLS